MIRRVAEGAERACQSAKNYGVRRRIPLFSIQNEPSRLNITLHSTITSVSQNHKSVVTHTPKLAYHDTYHISPARTVLRCFAAYSVQRACWKLTSDPNLHHYRNIGIFHGIMSLVRLLAVFKTTENNRKQKSMICSLLNVTLEEVPSFPSTMKQLLDHNFSGHTYF